ncbi:uncharacterized protein MELLADRAFT_41354, partial [Melampsora larici-populina 98AG31]
AAESILIKDQDYNHRLDLNQLMSSCQKNGSQATTLYQSIKPINKMVSLEKTFESQSNRSKKMKKRFLGFTSNSMSSGLREILKFSTKLSYLSVIVLTAGGIQDDIVKCLGSTYLSSFDSNSRSNSHKSGSICIENLFVPNENY